MSQPHQAPTEKLARQCFSRLGDVTFPDLATRQLFEQLIQESAPASMDVVANSLAQQKLL
jgi:hypothetical protein